MRAVDVVVQRKREFGRVQDDALALELWVGVVELQCQAVS